MQVLRGVVILHAERNLVIHAADRIHDRRDALKVDDHIVIRLKAHQALDLGLGLLDAADGIGRVDLAARTGGRIVAHGVARDVHDVDRLFVGVHRSNHERVCACFVLIDRTDHKGYHIVNARARIEQAANIDLIAVFLVLDRGVVRLRRADKNRSRGRHADHQHKDDRYRDDDPPTLLRPGELFFYLCAFFARGLGRGPRRLRRCGVRLLGSRRRPAGRFFAYLLCAAVSLFTSAAASKKFQTIFASSVHSSRQRTPCRIISLYAAMVSL